MDVRTIDLIIGAVGSLPFLAIAGYVLWLEYRRRQVKAGAKASTMKYSLRSLMIGIALLCVVLGLRVEYLRRMAAYHDVEADKARLLLAPDGYSTGDDASYNTMMSHKQKAHEYRQAVYGPWGRKWGDLSGLHDDYREPLRPSNPPARLTERLDAEYWKGGDTQVVTPPKPSAPAPNPPKP